MYIIICNNNVYICITDNEIERMRVFLIWYNIIMDLNLNIFTFPYFDCWFSL